jgi:hypothetical protein
MRMTMSHAGFDQGPQIIAEFEHHGRTPARTDPTQSSDLHRQGVNRSIIERSVSHVQGVGVARRAGSK